MGPDAYPQSLNSVPCDGKGLVAVSDDVNISLKQVLQVKFCRHTRLRIDRVVRLGKKPPSSQRPGYEVIP